MTNVEALVGVGFFKAAASGTGGGFTPGSTVVIDNSGATITRDAAAGSIKFTDDAALPSDVIIQHFTSDDRIQTTAQLADYSFAVADVDPVTGLERDLVITFTPSGGVTNSIVLDDVLVGHTFGFIDSYASAQAAVGFDFMIFG